MICRPDAVVMGFPAVWAVAGLRSSSTTALLVAAAASAANVPRRVKLRIVFLSLRDGLDWTDVMGTALCAFAPPLASPLWLFVARRSKAKCRAIGPGLRSIHATRFSLFGSPY